MWLNPQSHEERKVRKILHLEAKSSVNEGSGEVTASVAIRIYEGGEIWKRGLWEEMTPVEFAEWRGGAHDSHAATAVMTKVIDRQSGEIRIERQEIVGDGAKQPASKYSETESGINLALDWEGDVLKMRWTSGQTEPEVREIKIPFSDRFRARTTPESDSH